MGYTRSMRYANRKGGRKYDSNGTLLPKQELLDPVKLASARIFDKAWKQVSNQLICLLPDP